MTYGAPDGVDWGVPWYKLVAIVGLIVVSPTENNVGTRHDRERAREHWVG